MQSIWKVCRKLDSNVSYTKLLYPEILLIEHLTVIFEELTSKALLFTLFVESFYGSKYIRAYEFCVLVQTSTMIGRAVVASK